MEDGDHLGQEETEEQFAGRERPASDGYEMRHALMVQAESKRERSDMRPPVASLETL